MDSFSKQTRRHALKKLGMISAGTISLPSLGIFLESCQSPTSSNQASQTKQSDYLVFDQDQMNLVADLSDMIIPTTDTPGAKEAKVPECIDIILGDCYEPEELAQYTQGLTDFNSKFEEENNTSWKEASPEIRLAFLKKIDEETFPNDPSKPFKRAELENPLFFWALTKYLTVFSFFTSEPGATQTLNYLKIPQEYDPCLEMTDETKTWAT